ncbi:hypothetical protein HYPSUDRAFT_72352 [Hypholoma sublateritium FD-334 SS-4]|uniref:DDE Tnp4 domain-containing protein n=1 Tax=Hypholoma sublateritium (strain FD-334 SS-4) TaxID=945553 RepID=A0A0D2P2R0_HYPSF|nr:hypothetical protein HYPSUDRAFT_72352 [Hypholoma sublateritium FD-334 SS-4]
MGINVKTFQDILDSGFTALWSLDAAGRLGLLLHYLNSTMLNIKYNKLVTIQNPLLTGAFGVMDSLNLAVQELADQETENATYNGWLHDHFVSSVIAFNSTGLIIACKLNAPGSWHDAQVAQPIFEKL